MTESHYYLFCPLKEMDAEEDGSIPDEEQDAVLQSTLWAPFSHFILRCTVLQEEGSAEIPGKTQMNSDSNWRKCRTIRLPFPHPKHN